MTNIDASRLITAADKTSQKTAVLREQAKAECQRRIYAVCDETAQMNLAAACAAGLLSDDQLAIYRIGLSWVAAMRLTWAEIAAGGEDPAVDANWPYLPAGVSELTAAY